MAEIMLLLVFCLLIVMATFLTTEQSKRVAAEEKLLQQQEQNQRDRDMVAALRRNSAVLEKLQAFSGLTDPKEIDKYWRELVDSQTAMADLQKIGVSVKEVRERLTDLEKLRSNGLDIDKALRDVDVVNAINRAMAKPGQPPPSTVDILSAIEKGMTGAGPSGHQWPPIIGLSEALGYTFKSGSAELSPAFHNTLISKTPNDILKYIKKYNVDVIEVVGHTDEQPIGMRPSNLDRDLLAVLKSTANVATLVPADNAGLGLARAVSVVSVLRQSSLLAGYKLIPLSGAQLVNTDETLAILGIPANVPERRRIEIRLRKSVPQETTASIAAEPILPKPRPLAKQPQQPRPPSLAPKAGPRQIVTPAN
ncbi:hypothetical protein [Bradyrhizobium sp.]|uniref:hypothetical protein n=1 Tax=Bradyrhizobium sp. TaxID=376 RepID=UPI001D589F55|nr:hypothetical protein [Bradyrhizobium sp.]MBI5319810.1 hypothetical protein [Bradyrhizobium sp.]